MEQFEKDLAFFCAPALAGIKPSNLLSCSFADYPELSRIADEYNQALAGAKIRFTILCSCKSRQLLLVYRRDRLERQLSEPAVSALLSKLGYPVKAGVPAMLDYLGLRFRQEEFPHEIGLFLGYPVEDVLGFWENQGKNCRYCGHWKVYGDVGAAKRRFAQYDRCRAALCQRICQGQTLARLFATA